ncbi:uncharacterized protein LOC100020481 isoform X6 [Monodelphis domestica]|uniref:uncharacterized protein LOC100020481 isoform X6 n=1 Tax=Monodelphis domestica TaxID=13616 RepID=UPI0024E1BED1|nr:uncharacterized protein LOC100020481 isoform X6 [Monodelphis domestica]
MKPKTLRISRGGGEDGGRCHGNQEKGGAEVGGGRDAAEERPGELAALRAARALSHRGGRPQKRGGTRCGGSRAQASPNRGGSPFLAGSGMESLLPRGLKAPTGRLPDRESAMSNHSTPPFDPRFPNQNQTRNCYQNFLDFHRCTKIMKRRGKDSSPCDYYRKVQRWTDQIREGTFPGKI